MFVFQLKLAVLLQKFSKLLIHTSLLTCLKSCVTYITTRDVLRMFNCNFCVKKSQEKNKNFEFTTLSSATFETRNFHKNHNT